MLESIDNFLNKITMYRLMLYYLVGLWLGALFLSYWGKLTYDPLMLILSAVIILSACLITNSVFAHVFKTPTNVESVYITAFILVLIITPVHPVTYSQYLSLALWASVWAMACKYIIAIRKKHIFNPAALAVALTALTINQSASWWISTSSMLPLILAGGLLVVRKLQRADLVISYLAAAAVAIISSALERGGNGYTVAREALINSPILFFAFVMITEPLTTPPTRLLRIAYGTIVGLLFAPSFHLGPIYSTPELALLAGNVFSYLVSPKAKLILRLQAKEQTAPDAADFIFIPDRRLKFKPGQYLEWTLGHLKPDNRGNRRYFTLASSPTEPTLRLGVKFYNPASSFKRSLWAMQIGDEIAASQLAGDFVLPKNRKQKLVFIAGGIGITPFRSMVKYILDTNEQRTITIFYSNKTAEEIIYQDILNNAQDKLGIKTIYTLTDTKNIPADWHGHTGKIDSRLITQEVPDYRERIFYISGPHGIVAGLTETLNLLGIPRHHIKTDFFPGFA